MPFFSVIIPLYNRRSLVTEAIDSVLAQEYQDFELIVVDDGSTDGGPDVVAGYGERVKLLRQENQGPGAARNLGLKHASGDYVAFLDSDDRWFPWTLKVYRDLAARPIPPSMVHGKVWPFAGLEDLSAARESVPVVREFPDYLTAARGGIFIGAGVIIVRRDVMEAAGGFNRNQVNAEDHDLAMRIGGAGRFVEVSDPPLVAVRSHGAKLSSDAVKMHAGIRHMIAEELAGRYPGGEARRNDRRQVVARHARPVAVALLASGHGPMAWDLYRRTFPWHLRYGRFKFLAGFTVLALATLFRGSSRARGVPASGGAGSAASH